MDTELIENSIADVLVYQIYHVLPANATNYCKFKEIIHTYAHDLQEKSNIKPLMSTVYSTYLNRYSGTLDSRGMVATLLKKYILVKRMKEMRTDDLLSFLAKMFFQGLIEFCKRVRKLDSFMFFNQINKIDKDLLTSEMKIAIDDVATQMGYDLDGAGKKVSLAQYNNLKKKTDNLHKLIAEKQEMIDKLEDKYRHAKQKISDLSNELSCYNHEDTIYLEPTVRLD